MHPLWKLISFLRTNKWSMLHSEYSQLKTLSGHSLNRHETVAGSLWHSMNSCPCPWGSKVSLHSRSEVNSKALVLYVINLGGGRQVGVSEDESGRSHSCQAMKNQSREETSDFALRAWLSLFLYFSQSVKLLTADT